MPGSQRRSELAALDSVEVIDPLTVKLNLKAPSARSWPSHRPRRHDGLAQGGAGAGRQVRHRPGVRRSVQVRRAVAQDRITVEKFDKYWNKDNIFLKRIEFRTIPDSTVRLTNLRSGLLDLMERLAATDLPEVKAQGKLKVGSVYELGFQSILFNTRQGRLGHRQGRARAPGLRSGHRPRGAEPGGVQWREPARQPVGEPAEPVLCEGISAAQARRGQGQGATEGSRRHLAGAGDADGLHHQ